MQHMNKQRGGTFLGFILGMVAGLGIALAVAVYVTKVPVPFVDRAQSRAPDHDSLEAQKNKDWDPNAALQGKNPVRPIETVAPNGAADSATAPTIASTQKPEVKPAVSADPLGDLAKARSGGKSADPYYYFVQLGAFRTAADAESQRAKLSLGGIEAKVSEREQSGSTVYRVRVGPFDKKDEAVQAKQKLATGGLDTSLVSVAR